MSLILPPSRRIPVVPRPRHGELSGSYLARVARANGTDLRTFAGLLGRLPALAPDEVPDLAVMVLTLNAAAFDRLLSYTGLAGDQLIRAIPSLTPRTFRSSREPPAIRISFLRSPAADCPGCRSRRGGAYAGTRVFAHKKPGPGRPPARQGRHRRAHTHGQNPGKPPPGSAGRAAPPRPPTSANCNRV